MKKKLLTISLFLIVSLMGCSDNNYESHKNKILFEINDSYITYMPYEDIPTFTLEFEGIINIGDIRNNKYEVIFKKNDDFKLSEIISNLLKENEGYVGCDLLAEETSKTTKMNRLDYSVEPFKHEPVTLEVDDEKVFNENYFITLENGLQLSFNCRRFSSTVDGITTTYYTWQYTTSIRMILHYPFYVNTKSTGGMELLLITLPNNIKYHVGTSLSAVQLVSKETFLDQSYYHFNYLNYQRLAEIKDNKEMSQSEKDIKFDELYQTEVKYIKDYYIARWNGREVGGQFSFDYLGKTFNIEFKEFMFAIELA